MFEDYTGSPKTKFGQNQVTLLISKQCRKHAHDLSLFFFFFPSVEGWEEQRPTGQQHISYKHKQIQKSSVLNVSPLH